MCPMLRLPVLLQVMGTIRLIERPTGEVAAPGEKPPSLKPDLDTRWRSQEAVYPAVGMRIAPILSTAAQRFSRDQTHSYRAARRD